MNNFVVKLKYKDERKPKYANDNLIITIEELRTTNQKLLKHFPISLEKAQKLFVHLTKRNKTEVAYNEDHTLEYLSIVELSNYSGYREYQVVQYREFK